MTSHPIPTPRERSAAPVAAPNHLSDTIQPRTLNREYWNAKNDTSPTPHPVPCSHPPRVDRNKYPAHIDPSP